MLNALCMSSLEKSFSSFAHFLVGLFVFLVFECYVRATISHTLHGVNNRNLFFTVLEAGSLRLMP